MENTLHPILIIVIPLVVAFICGALRRNADSTFNWIFAAIILTIFWPIIPRIIDTSLFKFLGGLLAIVGLTIVACAALLAFVALCGFIHSLGKKCSQKFSRRSQSSV